MSANPEPLFPPSLLGALTHQSSDSSSSSSSADAKAFSLPDGYSIRPLRSADSEAGMLDVLRVLTTVGDISPERFAQRFAYMQAVNAVGRLSSSGGGGDNVAGDGSGGTYYVIVVCDGQGKIVGTGAVVVERKFIHDLGLVGHIEDIAVAKDQQGKRLGLRIIQALGHIAHTVGCYKTILDCSEANEGFYIKCGYKRAGLEMSRYY